MAKGIPLKATVKTAQRHEAAFVAAFIHKHRRARALELLKKKEAAYRARFSYFTTKPEVLLEAYAESLTPLLSQEPKRFLENLQALLENAGAPAKGYLFCPGDERDGRLIALAEGINILSYTEGFFSLIPGKLVLYSEEFGFNTRLLRKA